MKMRINAVFLLLFLIVSTVSSQTFETTYDGRSYGYVSSVRDQGAIGNCGVFASNGMLEASLLKQGIVTDTSFHLSTYDTTYFANIRYRGNTPNLTWLDDTQGYGDWAEGGWDAYHYGIRTGGYVAESVTSYPTAITAWTKESLTAPDANAQRTGYMTHDAYFTSMSTSAGESYETIIKSYVKNNGAATIAIYMDTSSSYYNSTSYAFRDTTSTTSNHAVLIVGWDDTKSITVNGVTTTGAWIVKNSWGTSFGDNGYFYVAYSSHIYDAESAVASTGYGKVYSHSQDLNLTSSGYNIYPMYALQRYEPTEDCFLQAISLSYYIESVRNGTSTDLASYELKIYSTKTGSGLSDLLYEQSGQLHDGINTIDLVTLVQLHAGDDFYILIKQIASADGTHGENYFLALVGGATGNGWYSDSDGTTFSDLALLWDGETWDIDALMAIPEPSTYALLLGGFICLGFVAVVRKKKGLSAL